MQCRLRRHSFPDELANIACATEHTYLHTYNRHAHMRGLVQCTYTLEHESRDISKSRTNEGEGSVIWRTCEAVVPLDYKCIHTLIQGRGGFGRGLTTPVLVCGKEGRSSVKFPSCRRTITPFSPRQGIRQLAGSLIPGAVQRPHPRMPAPCTLPQILRRGNV